MLTELVHTHKHIQTFMFCLAMSEAPGVAGEQVRSANKLQHTSESAFILLSLLSYYLFLSLFVYS